MIRSRSHSVVGRQVNGPITAGQPVSLYDKLAMPMHEAFKPSLSDTPDLAPFTAVKPLIPFAINEVGAPDQSLSQQQTWMPIDRVPMEVLNKIQYEAQGKVPPPG